MKLQTDKNYYKSTIDIGNNVKNRYYEDLYEACKSIQGVEGGIVYRGMKSNCTVVGFWCDWDKKIKPTYRANKIEKETIQNYNRKTCLLSN